LADNTNKEKEKPMLYVEEKEGRKPVPVPRVSILCQGEEGETCAMEITPETIEEAGEKAGVAFGKRRNFRQKLRHLFASAAKEGVISFAVLGKKEGGRWLRKNEAIVFAASEELAANLSAETMAAHLPVVWDSTVRHEAKRGGWETVLEAFGRSAKGEARSIRIKVKYNRNLRSNSALWNDLFQGSQTFVALIGSDQIETEVSETPTAVRS